MKPDGTYTVDEIYQICNDQLQSWEIEQLADKLVSYDLFKRWVRDLDVDELNEMTKYYYYEDEREEADIEDFSDWDIIMEIKDRHLEERVLNTIGEEKILKYVKENLELTEKIKSIINELKEIIK